MWEQIQSNRRKSAFLVVVMAAILVVLGYVIGEAYMGPGGGLFGTAIAVAVWIILSLIAYFQGDRILLASAGAKRIEKEDHPQLVNVVEEMCIATGKSKMPAVYIMNDTSMNAFAAGRNPDKAAVAVTAGLLANLNRDQLQGVIAHEMAHIKNRDVLLMSMVGVMLGAIVMISHVFLRSLWFTGGRSRRFSSSKGKGGGGAQAILVVVAIVLAILAPLLARLIYFAVSRKREYLADASAAVYTRYPEGLASALEQLGSKNQPLQSANRATEPMFIVNPKKISLRGLTSTHPPIQERVQILRNIGGSVSYGAYQQAWGAVDGKKAGNMPASALKDEKAQPVREGHPDTGKTPRQQVREAGDLLRKVNQFLFLPCPCGMRIKLPPEFKKEQVKCPKCSRILAVPVAQMESMEKITESIEEHIPGDKKAPPEKAQRKRKKAQEPLRIERKEGEWMSFKCSCGATKTLSPSFSAPRTNCNSCGREIHIRAA